MIGGFKLGDSWVDAKSKAGSTYKVRDEANVTQLRNDLRGDAAEGWFIGFHVVDGVAQSVEVTIHGSNRKGNAKAVTQASSGLKAHFTNKYGAGKCSTDPNGQSCQWAVPAGELWRTPPPDADKQRFVFLQYSKLDKSRFVRAGTR